MKILEHNKSMIEKRKKERKRIPEKVFENMKEMKKNLRK